MPKWTIDLYSEEEMQELRDLIKKQEEYIERLEQTIKNMTAHIRVDTDE